MNNFMSDVDNLDHVRKAALLVHTMSERDRSWILERLPINIASILVTYVAELSELGIPKDEKLIDSVLQSMPETKKASEIESSVFSMLKEIDGCSAKQIFGVLSEEPLTLIAHLLSLHDWAWHDSVLMNFDAASINQLREYRRARTKVIDLNCLSLSKYQRILLMELHQRLIATNHASFSIHSL